MTFFKQTGSLKIKFIRILLKNCFYDFRIQSRAAGYICQPIRKFRIFLIVLDSATCRCSEIDFMMVCSNCCIICCTTNQSQRKDICLHTKCFLLKSCFLGVWPKMNRDSNARTTHAKTEEWRKKSQNQGDDQPTISLEKY